LTLFIKYDIVNLLVRFKLKSIIQEYAMEHIRKLVLSILLVISSLSLIVLFVAFVCLIVYAFGYDFYPGSLLLWVRNPEVLTTLIILSGLLISSEVRIGGQELLEELSEKIEKKFQKHFN